MSATKVLVYVPREKCFTSGNYVAYDAETKPQYIRGDGEWCQNCDAGYSDLL